MLVRTEELTSDALDWAVAVCLGALWQPKSARASFFIWPDTPVKYSTHAPRYSTDWAQGGPIIEREGINPFRYNKLDPEAPYVWGAHKVVPRPNMEGSTNMAALCLDGPTPLIAAMRCFVASRLGDEVDIPEELMA